MTVKYNLAKAHITHLYGLSQERARLTQTHWWTFKRLILIRLLTHAHIYKYEQNIGSTKFFSTIDLESCFQQILPKKSDWTFSVYIYILINLSTLEEHIEHIRNIINVFHSANKKISDEKPRFFEIQYNNNILDIL